MKLLVDLEGDSWKKISQEVELAVFSKEDARYIVMNEKTRDAVEAKAKASCAMTTLYSKNVLAWHGLPIAITDNLMYGVIEVV